MNIRILLADDHEVMRDGLRSLLNSQPGMEVIAEAASGREAVELAVKKKPDVIIMDINMPNLSGIEATRQIVASVPKVKVIGLSMYSDKRFVVQLLKAGATGFLPKSSPFNEVVSAIKAVVANHTYVSPQIASNLIEDYVERVSTNDTSVFSVLTPREREVLQLIAEGCPTKKIASHLHISVKTVDTHRRQIMDKLDLHSIAELTKYAIQEGLTSARPK